MAEAKSIRLQSLLDPDAGPVAGDASRLQQIVWNLLTNAIKFTPKGGRVQVRVERLNSHIEIVVSDTGQGIAPEFLPHVFDRFRQADYHRQTIQIAFLKSAPVFASLIFRGRCSSMRHIESSQLLGFAEGRVDLNEQQWEHLNKCEDCRQVLALFETYVTDSTDRASQRLKEGTGGCKTG
jgi:hypothetical protein